MAPTTATRESVTDAILGLAVAVQCGDAVTGRRIHSALLAAGCLAASSREDARAVVLALDLDGPDAAGTVRAESESIPDRPVVVVTPPGHEWEVRRALRAGARGI